MTRKRYPKNNVAVKVDVFFSIETQTIMLKFDKPTADLILSTDNCLTLLYGLRHALLQINPKILEAQYDNHPSNKQ